MQQATRSAFSRRAFLQAVGLAGSASLLAAQAPAATPSNGEQTVNLLWTDAQNKRQPLIKDFEAATGIKVNQTQVAYNDLFNKITTSVQGGADIDVIEMDTIWTAQFASAGWVQDLTEHVTEALIADMPASALSAVTFRGKLYGAPWFNSAKHLFYNQKLLQEAGFERPPATLDEFVEQAVATTKDGQWGSTWCWKQGEGLICDWVAIMFAHRGARLLDDNGKAVFNDMGGADALQWMVDLLYTHKAADPASLENTENEVLRALETGRYALTYNWEGVLPEANDPAKSRAAPHVKVGLLPGGPEVKSSSVNGSEGWAILSATKRPQNAWALVAYMLSPAWQKKAALTVGDYPVLSSLYSDPDLLRRVDDFPLYGEQFNYLAVRPQVPGYAQKSDIIQRYLQEALLRKMSPQQAMDAAAAKVNQAGGAP